MNATTTIKASDYRDLIGALSQAFVSLRSARPDERTREAGWVKRTALELMNAGPRCPRATERDRQRAERLIDQTATYLIEKGL